MTRTATMHKKTRNRIYQAERRADLKSKGLCQWCGARPAKPSKRSDTGIGSRCEVCAKVAAKGSRENLRRRRPAWKCLGVCGICGCREAIPGQCWCGVCSERQQESKAAKRVAA